MPVTKLMVVNRGEIAIRILRAAAELGIQTVAIYSEDDAQSLHTRKVGEVLPLAGAGAAAYLDAEQIVALASESGCDAVHPGYGFLSENAAFAQRCIDASITFVGPRPETLTLFGDKTQARVLAEQVGVPLIRGLSEPATLDQARAFFESLEDGEAMMLKAVSGGGGRGMRPVTSLDELDDAFARCESEARASFGSGELYVEQLITNARHIEVQIVGDGAIVTQLWERDCSIQRRNQKLVEIAPAPALDPELRAALTAAAVRMAEAANYTSLGTFEFLVNLDAPAGQPGFAFIEANARLQVEHTVTEEVTGIDLVQTQLQLASGRTLGDLGLTQADVPAPRGFALQARVNMETMTADGQARPAGGTLAVFEVPSGPGLRTDSFGYAGYTTSPRYDSLLAKVIGHSPSPDFRDAITRTHRALSEFRIEGVSTNIPLLQSLLQHPEFEAGAWYTRFLDDHIATLVAPDQQSHDRFFFETATPEAAAAPAAAPATDATQRRAGATVAEHNPLAVLDYGKDEAPTPTSAAPVELAPVAAEVAAPDGATPVAAPMQGTIVTVDVSEGDLVRVGQQLIVMEAMKMEHVITATFSGIVQQITVAPGDTIFEDHPLAFIAPAEVEDTGDDTTEEVDLDHIRPDLAEVLERHAVTLDASRPDAVEKRRKTGQRTPRENIDHLVDPGSFNEHGGLVLTPGTGLPIEEVIRKFPTDGMVTGVGSINGDIFDDRTARTVILSYDYTVLAGTQGAVNHPKTDRMLELAEKWRLPVVFFTEGGGGRAGTGGRRAGGSDAAPKHPDIGGGRPLDTPTFTTMGRLSGLLPTVGITSGYCFAGNAALLGCCDVIIATANSNIGMGGPAMVEGGNLGVFRPDEIGGMDVQVPNGVVDIAVEDEAEAVEAAKKYLSYFQGSVKDYEAPDQRKMRGIVPENRLRIYDIREVIETLADVDSVLELRKHFGLGMVTSFIRINGQPIGVIANNPSHLAGAIDSDGADKAARFMQLLDAHDIPLLVLCDTPGMMVGPEVEKTALVRHCSRLFVTGANLTIPHFTVVLRKAYGLGAQAMAGGSFKQPFFAAAWPTGEFGGMGLEGQVKLGYRNELAAMEDPQERLERYNELVATAYERGKALNSGVSFGVDDVIDPRDTRDWLANGLRSVPQAERRTEKKRRNVDTW
jgi:acetyl/propionyl-CoA carboxylase alpha subunit/acetyl-CoA carboxylase carboxyltransferase component